MPTPCWLEGSSQCDLVLDIGYFSLAYLQSIFFFQNIVWAVNQPYLYIKWWQLSCVRIKKFQILEHSKWSCIQRDLMELGKFIGLIFNRWRQKHHYCRGYCYTSTSTWSNPYLTQNCDYNETSYHLTYFRSVVHFWYVWETQVALSGEVPKKESANLKKFPRDGQA